MFFLIIFVLIVIFLLINGHELNFHFAGHFYCNCSPVINSLFEEA